MALKLRYIEISGHRNLLYIRLTNIFMPSNQEKLKSNIWKYYLNSFLSSMGFFGPIYILFFQSFGFSLSQIFFFLSIYGITTMVFEIPTGIFSDYFGRKNTLIISSVAFVLALSLISL